MKGSPATGGLNALAEAHARKALEGDDKHLEIQIFE